MMNLSKSGENEFLRVVYKGVYMKKSVMLLFIVVFALTNVSEAKVLNLSVVERNWYPFSYNEEGIIKGMHVDIVKKALDDLGYNATVKVLPSKRGVRYAKSGEIDGVISIAYSPEMSKVFDFPQDSDAENESKWRIMQVDHIILTHKDIDYEFTGDIKSLPGPVRIPIGETFAANLREAGHVVYETRTDMQNFMMLIRDGTGSVITTSVVAERLFLNPEFTGQFNIQAVPLVSQSYHLGFSKKTFLTKEEKQKIWEEIARLRDDYVYMLQLFAQY